MLAFLETVVKGLVDRPDAVVITTAERGGMAVYELRVHPTDMGKIIGRQGATINAIRALLLVGSAKRGLRCALEVIDEENPGGEAGGAPRSPREGGSSYGGERRFSGGDRGGRRDRPFRGGAGGGSGVGGRDRI